MRRSPKPTRNLILIAVFVIVAVFVECLGLPFTLHGNERGAGGKSTSPTLVSTFGLLNKPIR